ncbi:pyridoxal phosphate-dependent decarboxylase family protein [Chengkuizengella sediminis]|uniref:pyridoxal phosphate-dependent decarboxylase family protein n=1 Tax=Chengkuizengella sediminis TaxID=1885917 RepID=UPI0013895DEB|nr:aspartate aminotransferase family protein [Chengkuizengella sediminis]NDI36042.1 aspartate aminotransferase family protein [Chengkuizengella sediminis]
MASSKTSEKVSIFDHYFPANNEESIELFEQAMLTIQHVVQTFFKEQSKPYSGANPNKLNEICNEVMQIPNIGMDLKKVIEKTGAKILENSIGVTHPTCLAHLHTPPLTASIVGEVIMNVMNASMDSWDQSAVATHIEEQMIQWLVQVYGFSQQADGIFTSGGTQSNFMGILLARDHFIFKKWHWNVKQKGLPPEANRMRILCSKEAHFTVSQSAALLGLGEDAVIAVDTDDNARMRPDLLRQKLETLKQDDYFPFVIVATAGTTDFGSIDPLFEIGELSESYNIWLHIDAAYGGAIQFSDQHKRILTGIEQADSLTIDFHKWFYQSISCGAFLVKNRLVFQSLHRNADYLNSLEDEQRGIPNLVGKSIQTTRRFDALKLLMSLQHVGLERFSQMIDYTIHLAKQTATYIDQDPSFDLIQYPTLSTVIFRYRSKLIQTMDLQTRSNEVHQHIRLGLLQSGEAVVAKTKVDGWVSLKFTLLNPRTEMRHIQHILHQIKQIGESFDQGRVS